MKNFLLTTLCALSLLVLPSSATPSRVQGEGSYGYVTGLGDILTLWSARGERLAEMYVEYESPGVVRATIQTVRGRKTHYMLGELVVGDDGILHYRFSRSGRELMIRGEFDPNYIIPTTARWVKRRAG